MKKLIIGIISVIATLAIGLGVKPVIAMGSVDSQSNKISTDTSSIIVTIHGLEKNDEATLILCPEMDESPDSVIVNKKILGGAKSLEEKLSVDLKDGNYQLIIDTTDKYFRTPRGYLFKIHDGKLINIQNDPIVFDLIPPSERQYKPYRSSTTIDPDVITDEGPYMMEYLIGLSVEPKSIPGTKDSGKHWAGLTNLYDCEGIWGRMGVVDTGVRHDIGLNTEFIADQI